MVQCRPEFVLKAELHQKGLDLDIGGRYTGWGQRWKQLEISLGEMCFLGGC